MGSLHFRVWALIIIFSGLNFAQNYDSKEICIFPFTSTGLDYTTLNSSEAIFRFELEKYDKYKLLPEVKIQAVLNDTTCNDQDCVAKYSKLLNADFAFSCNMLLLGDKIVVQYYLMDVDSGKVTLREQTTSETIEDLETVMKRVARSVALRMPINEKVEVGTITQNEAEKKLLRSSTRNFGLSFGYTFPQGGYGSYEKSFTLDLRGGYELQDFATGMLIGLRKGFAMNIYGDYLFSREDISPYVGGALGFHWVLNEHRIFSEQRGDGFEISARCGLMI